MSSETFQREDDLGNKNDSNEFENQAVDTSSSISEKLEPIEEAVVENVAVVEEKHASHEVKESPTVEMDIFTKYDLNKRKVFQVQMCERNSIKLQFCNVGFLWDLGAIGCANKSGKLTMVFTADVRNVMVGGYPKKRALTFGPMRGVDKELTLAIECLDEQYFVFVAENVDANFEFAIYLEAFLRSFGSRVAGLNIPKSMNEKTKAKLFQAIKTEELATEALFKAPDFLQRKRSDKLNLLQLQQKSTRCQICLKNLNVITERPHECKNCKKIACEDCSQSLAFVSKYQYHRVSRVCDECRDNVDLEMLCLP